MGSYHCLTRACSGWPQHSGIDPKTLTTAEAQAVMLLCVVELTVQAKLVHIKEGKTNMKTLNKCYCLI
jgi:hypothetical protein